MRSSNVRDRGVAAVEFALIAPLLVALIFGAVEYGLRFSDKAGYNNAAAAAARSYAINNNTASATAAARNAGVPTSVTPTYSFKFDSGSTAANCAAASDGSYPSVTVVITRNKVPNFTVLAGLLPGIGSTHTITGKAVARCAV